MKTLAESIFNTDKDLKFGELVDLDIKIDKLKANDRYRIKGWIESHTNISHYLTAPNWKVLIVYITNDIKGFVVCKDLFCKFEGEQSPKMHVSTVILKVFYDKQKKGVMFLAETEYKKKIPSDCTHEWAIIHSIVDAFGAIPYKSSDNEWILSVKP